MDKKRLLESGRRQEAAKTPTYQHRSESYTKNFQDGVEKQLCKEQAGYRRRSITKLRVFTLRNIKEQCTEWNSTLFVIYVDFEKAFDSIHSESLESIMKFYGIPDNVVRMVKLLYESFQCAVLDDGEETDWFRETTGGKQGSTMSGFLFCWL
ncbi:uncharacterized protein LOC134237141 [Saccostrea cucullata]|uniref:uncharacterized protein LOC134237141 n=1 Tax=Saccostrea cuccullata TaxID=36930 RepID=UPI002ED534EC